MIYDLKDRLAEQLEAIEPELTRLFGFKVQPVIQDSCAFTTSTVLVHLNDPDGMAVAGFALTEMPNCPYIVISNEAWVAWEHRNKGIGKLLHQVRLQAVSAAGVEQIMCTVNNGNEVEQKILLSNGWEMTKRLMHVSVWMKKLTNGLAVEEIQ